ncbi:MAG: ATP-binding protein [Desulfovermiculus sp.]|nr:ATP-binding protein [Desulfovermiculus sp.]
MTYKVFRSSATPEQVCALTRVVADFLKDWIQDAELIYDLRLVLSEACTNVLLHGYGPDTMGDLEVHIYIEPLKRICMELRDKGAPFSGPEHSLCSGPHDERGRGLYIMSRLVDSFSYKHEQGQNTLRIERYIEERAWKG